MPNKHSKHDWWYLGRYQLPIRVSNVRRCFSRRPGVPASRLLTYSTTYSHYPTKHLLECVQDACARRNCHSGSQHWNNGGRFFSTWLAAGRLVSAATVSHSTTPDSVFFHCFPVVREEDGGRVGPLKRGPMLTAGGLACPRIGSPLFQCCELEWLLRLVQAFGTNSDGYSMK